MRTLRAPKRVFLGVLALSLACTLTPIAPSYAAETNETPLASGVKNAVIAEASQADQSAAQTDGNASAADASAGDSASRAVSAADQATASTQPSAGESAGAGTGEAEGAPASAATASNTSASAAPIEIISGQVSLEDAAAARTLIQQNGLTFIDNTDGTATMVGWSGSAPQGELSIPAQVNGLAVTNIDFLAQVPLVTDDLDLSDAARAVAESNAVAAAMQAPAVTRLSIPASVATINTASFAAFPGLVAIEVAADNQIYSSYNGMLFDEQLSHLHLVPEAMEGVAVLPASLATVPACVISRCTKLFGLDIPTGGAADAAFAVRNGILYAKNLTPSGTPDGTLTLLAAPMGIGASTVIDASCTSIAEGAFWGNTALKTIVVKGTVDRIAAGSFAAAVAEGEEGAPINTAMPLGEDGTVWAALPAFSEEAPKNATVALMVGETEHAFAKGAWEAAGFTRFADPATPGDTAETDGFVFTLLDDFTLAVTYEGEAQGDIAIPAQAELGGVSYGVTRIADAAFENQTGMTSVSIPESITSIGARAFAGCTSLASASLPGSVVNIGTAAFSGCSALGSVELHEGTTTISEGAFAGTALTSITLPKTMRTVSAAVFEDCAHLEQVLMLGTQADISSTALGNTSGVKIYTPYSESGPLWPQLPASGNTVCEYGVAMPSDPIALTVGDEIYLPNYEGVSLHSAGDITTSYTYKGYPVYVDTEGTVKAKTPGTAPVNVMLYLGSTLLAKATVTVMVQAAAEEEREVITPEPIVEAGETGDLQEEDENGDEGQQQGSAAALYTVASLNLVNFSSSTLFNSLTEHMSLFNESVSRASGGVIEYRGAGPVTILGASPFTRYYYNLDTDKTSTVAGQGNHYTPRYKMGSFNLGSTGKTGPDGQKYKIHLTGKNTDNNNSCDYYVRLTGNGDITSIRYAFENAKPFADYKHTVGDCSAGSGASVDSMSHAYLYVNGYGTRTVTFNANGGLIGSASTSSATVKPYEIKNSPTPTRTGYTFAGWYTASSGGSRIMGANEEIESTQQTTILGNQTLYAQWNVISYTITWNPNGGTWSDGTTGNKTTSVAYGSRPSAPATLTKAATAQYTYAFTGWSPSLAAVTGATTYTAAYSQTPQSYSISASAGTGVNTITPSISSYSFSTSAQSFTVTATARTGYNASKLTLTTSTTGVSFSNNGTARVTVTLAASKTGNVTVTGSLAPSTYTVSFNANGGTGAPNAVTATYGAAMPTPLSSTPSKTGVTFAGWWDTSAATGGTMYYNANNASVRNFDKTSSTTLYARYYATPGIYANGYPLTWNSSGTIGGASTGTISATGSHWVTHRYSYNINHTYGVLSSYGLFTNLSDGSYVTYTTANSNNAIIGWSTSSLGSIIGSGSGSYTGQNLYAQWKNTVVTLNPNFPTDAATRSTNHSTSANTTYNTDMPSITAPSAGGYTFLGYFYGDTKYYNADGTSAKKWDKGGNATLTGKWERKTLTLTLSNKSATSNGTSTIYLKYGVGYYSNSTCTASITKLPTNPSRTAYTFAGYSGLIDKDGKITAGKTDYYENKSFDPSWDPIEYDITYQLNHGSMPSGKTNPSTYTVETTTFTLNNPERTGYTFTGWTITGASNITGGGVVNGTSAQVKKGTYGALTCSASWEPKVYTVRFDTNVGDTGDVVRNMPSSFSIKYSDPWILGDGVYNETKRIPSNVPTRTGYTFVAWELDETTGNNEHLTLNYAPESWYAHLYPRDITLKAMWKENSNYRINFYKFTEDGADDRIEFTPDYANLKYEDKFQLPGRGNVPDNDKVSGYYLYGWSWSREAGPDGSAQATTFVIPASATLDDRVSVRDILTALGGGTPEEPENAEINLYAVWQMVYSVSAPTSSDATGIVLDASEVAVYRPADITFTNTTPCEVAVGAYSEYDKAIFEGVFPNTRVRDVDFSFIEAGADEDSAKYFQLNGDALDDETWRRRLTRLSQGSAAIPSTLDAQLSFDFNKSSVNISHELQEDADGILMNGKHWERPIARITWLLSPDETTALTYTLLPHMPAAGSAPGHGEVDLASDSLPFVKDEG